MLAHAPSLADVVRDVALGVATPEQLHATFLDSVVYCERADIPGFRALGAPRAGVIPVFTSPEQLALARGTVAWFAVTGAELLPLVPVGYDLLIDMGGSTPLRLRTAGMTARPAVDVRREPAP